MDVYSFGVLMWELLHEKQPFDGDLSSAIEYVVKQDARPAILTSNLDDSVMRESMRDELTTSKLSSSKRTTNPLRDTKDLDQENMVLTEDLANIIRRCW